MGVSVHSSSCGDGVESLNGKVNISQLSILLEEYFISGNLRNTFRSCVNFDSQLHDG